MGLSYAICFEHCHHPAGNCDVQSWEFCSRESKGWTCLIHEHQLADHKSRAQLCRRHRKETAVLLLELLHNTAKLNALGKTTQTDIMWNEVWNLLHPLTYPILWFNKTERRTKVEFFINNPNQSCAAKTEKTASSTNFRTFLLWDLVL